MNQKLIAVADAYGMTGEIQDFQVDFLNMEGTIVTDNGCRKVSKATTVMLIDEMGLEPDELVTIDGKKSAPIEDLAGLSGKTKYGPYQLGDILNYVFVIEQGSTPVEMSLRMEVIADRDKERFLSEYRFTAEALKGAYRRRDE